MRLREGCAAKMRAGDQDTVPAAAVVAASFINWRRLSVDDRACSLGVFLFFAIKFLSPSQEICPQPFNRPTMACQSIHHPLRKLYKVLSDHGVPESRLSSVV